MNNTLFNKLIDKFDYISILTLSSRKDRRDAIIDQLEKIGMHYTEFSSFNIELYYATPFPHNDVIANAFNTSGRGRFSKANEYDCARNHYAIIKKAYDLGYEHLLVMEDDIKFLKDTNKFIEYIKNIPGDYDILQFGGFTTDHRIDKYLTSEADYYWFAHKDVGVWNCSMYALSRKGMEYYLAFMNRIFWVADGPLYKAPLNDKLINTYLSKTPLVIQADKDQVSSDIRNENNDTIDYKNDNRYEQFINKDDYFEYKN